MTERNRGLTVCYLLITELREKTGDRMKHQIFTYLLLLASGLIVGCGEQAADTQTTPDEGSAELVAKDSGILWYAGTVDEAFAEAKAENKPVYLYWGAEWCPPCHAISATVFKSKSFIDRSRSFVAVYLDGDTANAQATGESFGVYGYPTMIVFDPSGTEITRIPGGMDMQAYATVLDLTLADVAPVAEIVSRVVEGGETLESNDCRLVAYYSWGQDREIMAERDAASVFESLEAACPVDLVTEKSILYLGQLSERIDAASDEEAPLALTAVQKSYAFDRISAILDDHTLVKANVFDVAFGGAEITAALTESETTERQQLQDKFLVALERLFNDENVYLRERLYTLAGKIDFERIDDEEAEISDSLKEEIREKINWADETTTNPYERHPIINAAANILDAAGMNDVAQPMLLAEIEHAKQPYYFMVTLADIEQTAGNNEAALDWLKRAYDATTGPATRFQWGYYYVSGLIEMTPDDAEMIRSATVNLVREIEASGGFYQRPKAQLKRLEAKLRDWNADESVLAGIRDEVKSICAEPSDDAETETSACQDFLTAA